MSASTVPVGGVGITLGYNLGGSSSYTSLGELMDDCGFDGFDTTVIPIKPLNASVVTKAAGRTDYGTFTGSLYLVNSNAGVAELQALAASRTSCAWQVQLSDGATLTTSATYVFSGFVSNVAPGNFTGEDTPTISFTIAISGLVNVTPGS